MPDKEVAPQADAVDLLDQLNQSIHQANSVVQMIMDSGAVRTLQPVNGSLYAVTSLLDKSQQLSRLIELATVAA